MDDEEYLRFIEQLVIQETHKSLNVKEINVLRGIWDGKTYDEIASDCCFTYGHTKYLGMKILQKITDCLKDVRVTQKSLKPIIKNRFQIGNQIDNKQINSEDDSKQDYDSDKNDISVNLPILNQNKYEHLKDINSWLKEGKTVYSAPGSIFFGGEHSVIYGHPAIYYPIPLRIYLQIELDTSIERININEFKVANPRKPEEITHIELIDDYGRRIEDKHIENLNKLYRDIFFPFLRKDTSNNQKRYGFNIQVYSEFSVGCGLNSSGAISICIAKALIDNYLDINLFANNFELPNKSKNKVLILVAWLIENCFHNNSSSGCGVHSALYGRKGKHPLIYCTSKRSHLLHRISKGWELANFDSNEKAIKKISKIKTFVLNPSEIGNGGNFYPAPPTYNLTIIYSGVPSKTADILSQSIRDFQKSHKDCVQTVYNKLTNIFSNNDLNRTLEVHIFEIIKQIYLNEKLESSEINSQLTRAYSELLYESLGNISVGMINSILSDWQTIPNLMNSYQAILSSAGLSDLKTDIFIAKLRLASLEKQLKQKQRSTKLAAKITGSGKGGNMIVFSLLNNEEHKGLINSCLEEGYVIHFDSCTFDCNEWNSIVEGVRKEKL